MKQLISLALPILFSLFAITADAAENKISDIKRIECENINGRGDHHTITPNVYKNNGKVFAAVSGYYEVGGGRVDRKDFFYEMILSKLENGTSRVQLYNDNTQFMNNREMNLFTTDYRTGTLHWSVFQPGVGGYGPDGIPESTGVTNVYHCEFINVVD